MTWRTLQFYRRTIRWAVSLSLISYLFALIMFAYTPLTSTEESQKLLNIEIFSITISGIALAGLLVKLLPWHFSVDRYAYLLAGGAGLFTTLAFLTSSEQFTVLQTLLYLGFLTSGIFAAFSAYLGEIHDWGTLKE